MDKKKVYEQQQPSNFINGAKNPKTKNDENKETDHNNIKKICQNCGKENNKKSNKCKYCYKNLNNNILIQQINKHDNSNNIKQEMVCFHCITLILL